jgi:putative oxidoreductase
MKKIRYNLTMKKYITLQNLGWVLTAVVTIMLGMSGVSKVIGTQEMVNNFTYINLLPYLTTIGVAELVGVILLIIPRTSGYGALILSSIMSAAAAVHLSYMGGDKVLIPILLGILAWSAHCLRKYTK